VDGLADKAIRALRDPASHRPLGDAARRTCLERYEKTLCINQLVRYFKEFEKPKVDSIFASMGGIRT
jgi:hypothetical protein